MSIQSEIQRLNQAKTNLKTAITGKGVAVSDSDKLDTYYTLVNEIQQGGGESGGTDVSATTATEADVLNGKKFYKADGSFVTGNIQTVTPTLTDNVFTVEKGYVSEKKTMTVPTVTPTLNANTVTIPVGYIATQQTLTVPEMADVTISANTVTIPVGYNATNRTVSIPKATATLTANTVTIPAGYHDENTLTVAESVITETATKVTIGVGYVGTAKEYNLNSGGGGSTSNTAGVLIDDNGVLKVQKLTFDGTSASDDGEPVSADKFYMFNTGKAEPDYGSGSSSGGTWEIYQIKDYIPENSIVESYNFQCTTAYADALNGIYTRKVKSGYVDRYINAEKGKVLLSIALNPSGYSDGWHEMTKEMVDLWSAKKRWVIHDANDSDSYTFDRNAFDGSSNPYTYSSSWDISNACSSSWTVRKDEGSSAEFNKGSAGYPISVEEYVPQTIIANKVLSYSGDTPTAEDVDTYLTGMQYSIEVGKSYVVQDNKVIGHPCFMPDKRIALIMSGMDDYDANANGIYTQNDFMESSQLSTWSNSNGYTIKYDYMNSQWGCFAPNGSVVANGGYGNSPLGATWYEMVNWSGAEVTLELYTE